MIIFKEVEQLWLMKKIANLGDFLFIKKENLMKLDFHHYNGDALAFEVGDTFI